MLNPLLKTVLALVVLPALALPQSSSNLFKRAPAGVEEQLRARVEEFFKMQMAGQFRAAEKFVCEASQEAYYNSDKRRWLSLEIVRVNFPDGYESANVVVALGTEMMTPMARLKVTPVLTTIWKTEGGSWCYFIPTTNVGAMETPFGTMSSAPVDGANPGGAGAPPPRAQIDENFVRSAVRVSRTELRVKGYEESFDVVEILNGLPGGVELSVEAASIEGLDINLSKTKLEGNGKAELKVNYRPKDKTAKPALKFALRVEPSAQVIPFTILFEVQKELMNQVPDLSKPRQ